MGKSSADSGGCYYGKDFVHLVDGGKRRVEELKLGDRIWSIDPNNPDQLLEDEIMLMAHNEPNRTGLHHFSRILESKFEIF